MARAPLAKTALAEVDARATRRADRLFKLIASADAEPADLYASGDGRFEFDRTISRLQEMQSADYLAAGHGEE